MPKPIIHPASPADLPALVGLLHQLFSIEQDFQPDPEKQSCGLELLLTSDRAQVFVAKVDGRAVGMLTLQILVSTAQGGQVGLVEDVVVDVAHRGRGIGDALLEHLRQWAQQRGLSRLQLLADRDNLRALEFYRKQGWSTTGLVGLRLLLPAKDASSSCN
jgi:ribosomal protein S18 acetylase RimI-like enzyme